MRHTLAAAALVAALAPLPAAHADPAEPAVCTATKAMAGDYSYTYWDQAQNRWVTVGAFIDADGDLYFDGGLGGTKVWDCPPYGD